MSCSVVVRGIAALLLASCRRARPRRRRPIRPGRSPSWCPFRPAPPPISPRGCCASRSSEALGQPVVVENRPGAGGTTGAAAVANAAPDGHTLLVTVNAPVTMNVYMQKNFPFDPKTALAPIVTRRRRPAGARRQRRGAGQERAGAHRLRQEERRQEAELRQRRHRIGASHRRRTAQAEDRHRHAARALSRRRPGDPGPGGRPYPDQLRHHAGGVAAGQRRHHADPGAGRKPSAARICPAFRPSPRRCPAW